MTQPTEPPPEEYPATFNLNKLVKANLQLQPGRPRAPGFHPSEMPYMCPVHAYYVWKAREDLGSTDLGVARGAWEFLRRSLNAKESSFSPGSKMEMDFGSAVHQLVQYRLGLIGKLWGRWKCPACRKKTSWNGWMPRMTQLDCNGDPGHMAPAPCAKCRGRNLRSRVPWLYVEPEVTSDEWKIVGHCDGYLLVQRDGREYWFALEIKSAHNRKWKGDFGPLPTPEHVEQASVYGWLLGLSHIYFIYVNKDQVNKWKEIIVPVDAESVARVQSKIRMVLEALRVGAPPLEGRVCPHVQDERAKKCPSCEQCWGRLPETGLWD